VKALVVIPTYNEKPNLTKLLPAIFDQKLGVDVLIVDDNSPDGTGQYVKDLAHSLYQRQLFLLAREGKQGLGKAYIAGFQWALSRDYEIVISMDADFSHPPKLLPDLLQNIEAHDEVIASRYISGGGVKNWPWLRRMISQGGNLYARFILKTPIKDLTGGYKCYRATLLQAISLETLTTRGFAFQIEITYRTFKKGLKIKEIPFTFIDREIGSSKMSAFIFIEALWAVWRMR